MLRSATLLQKSTKVRVFLMALIFVSTAAAADNVTSEYQRKLDQEMKKLNDRHSDIRKELDEEYVAISRERDKNCNAIFEKVRKLKEEHQKEQANFAATMGSLRESLTRENINPADQRYIESVTPLNDRQNRISRAYDSSLTTLQQLYQLNDKRFNDLLKIHSARETLEDNRLREERDVAARRLANDARNARSGLSPSDKQSIELRGMDLDTVAREIDTRYHNSLDALDEFKGLVQKRMKAQGDYLTEHDAILRDITRDAVDPMDKVTYVERLDQLNADKNAGERRYQNDVRFVEEKLAYQQQRNRELSRLDTARREAEESWLDTRGQLESQRESLAAQIERSATDADRKTLEQRVADTMRKLESEKKSYEESLKNLDERRKLAERALDERYAYIKDRNAIRVRMAEQPMNSENFDGFRDEIGKLEERRIESEREIRNQMTELGAAMPAAYRQVPWYKGNLEARKVRWSGRFDAMRKNLDAGWKELEQQYQNELTELDQRLNASGVSEADRMKIQEQQKTLQDNQKQAEANYATAIKELDQHRQAAEQNLSARENYMSERDKIRNGLNSDKASYNDIARYHGQLRDLDNRWDSQERQFRDRQRQFQAGYPAAVGSAGTQPASGTAAGRTSPSRNAAAGQDGASGNPGVVKRAYESAKDAVVDTYRDAVHYLTD